MLSRTGFAILGGMIGATHVFCLSCALSASITGKPEQCYWEVGLLKHTPASAIERLARTADSHTPIAHW